MKRISFFALVVLVSCATVKPGMDNYLEAGSTVPALKGNAFYMALGRVNVYAFGLLRTKSVDTAVGVQVDKETGRIIRIVTVQQAGRSVVARNQNTTVYGEQKYAVDDLVGGIAYIEIYPMKTWAETLSAVDSYAARL